MASLLNRSKMITATTGTGTMTLGSASAGFLTFAEAGAVDATQYSYCIEDGADFELGVGTYTSAGTTLSRDTVTVSKISGTAGTSKINLSGGAVVFVTTLAEALDPLTLFAQEGGADGAVLVKDGALDYVTAWLATTAFGRSLLGLADAAGLTAEVDTFTTALKGAVPASGGGASNFLRADGTWAAPAGEGIGLPPLTELSAIYGGPTGVATAIGNANWGVNRLQVLRLRVAKATTLTELAIRLNTGSAAGGVCRLGIYDSLLNGMPNLLLYGSGSLATDLTNTVVAVTGLSINLDPGKDYWLAANSSLAVNGAAFRINNTAGAPIGYHVAGSAIAPMGAFFKIEAYGPLLADLSGVSVWSVNVSTDLPFIFWR